MGSEREITELTAISNLEEAVKKFNWGKEFLGVDFEGFIRAYRALHAQLREGDELRFEIECCEDEKGPNYPSFNIVLHTSGGKTKLIDRSIGYGRDRPIPTENIVLYDDV